MFRLVGKQALVLTYLRRQVCFNYYLITPVWRKYKCMESARTTKGLPIAGRKAGKRSMEIMVQKLSAATDRGWPNRKRLVWCTCGWRKTGVSTTWKASSFLGRQKLFELFLTFIGLAESSRGWTRCYDSWRYRARDSTLHMHREGWYSIAAGNLNCLY